jgi:uncharacterized LabA/DUF88 family protein
VSAAGFVGVWPRDDVRSRSEPGLDVANGGPESTRLSIAGTPLPARTSGLATLYGRRVLVLLDGENISYSLKPTADCDYAKLAALLLQHATGGAALHAFASAQPGAAVNYARSYFSAAGYVPHVEPIEVVNGAGGMRKRANSDNEILMHGARLIATERPDWVVLASGDGDLGCDLARLIARETRGLQFMTLGLWGSFSRRLRVEQNQQVTSNSWIGADVLVRLRPRQ